VVFDYVVLGDGQKNPIARHAHSGAIRLMRRADLSQVIDQTRTFSSQPRRPWRAGYRGIDQRNRNGWYRSWRGGRVDRRADK